MGLQGSSQAQLPLVNQNELGVSALCRALVTAALQQDGSVLPPHVAFSASDKNSL